MSKCGTKHTKDKQLTNTVAWWPFPYTASLQRVEKARQDRIAEEKRRAAERQKREENIAKEQQRLKQLWEEREARKKELAEAAQAKAAADENQISRPTSDPAMPSGNAESSYERDWRVNSSTRDEPQSDSDHQSENGLDSAEENSSSGQSSPLNMLAYLSSSCRNKRILHS